jgi:hypothetical protein
MDEKEVMAIFCFKNSNDLILAAIEVEIFFIFSSSAVENKIKKLKRKAGITIIDKARTIMLQKMQNYTISRAFSMVWYTFSSCESVIIYGGKI